MLFGMHSMEQKKQASLKCMFSLQISLIYCLYRESNTIYNVKPIFCYSTNANC